MAINNPPTYVDYGSPGDWTEYNAGVYTLAYISEWSFEIELVDESANPVFQPGEYIRVDGEIPGEVVATITSVFYDDANTEFVIEEVAAATPTVAKRYPRWIIINDKRYWVKGSEEERQLLEWFASNTENQVRQEGSTKEAAQKLKVRIEKRQAPFDPPMEDAYIPTWSSLIPTKVKPDEFMTNDPEWIENPPESGMWTPKG